MKTVSAILIGLFVLMIGPILIADYEATQEKHHKHTVGCDYFANFKCVDREVCLQNNDTLIVIKGEHRVWDGNYMTIDPVMENPGNGEP